ncbi:MAG TPA: phosphate ABC transporter permease PstA [Aestuariivirgaceae bacterium]|nr:phosphate ABC transporter permease PstA [Aestuariivirgaceae bacterium]
MANARSRGIDFTSDAARRHLARRHRAEARFRSNGIISLAITAIFLLVLISDVVVKGVPAFWQHSLLLDIAVDPASVDPGGTRDAAAIARADFGRLIKDRLAALFPEVGTRAQRKLLNGLLSSGAADDLRRRILADPALIGKTIAMPALLSDDADLYLKGTGTGIAARSGEGVVTVSLLAEGRLALRSTAPDFAPALAAIKSELAARAQALEDEVKRLRGQGASAARLKATELESQARTLRARASAPIGAENLDGSLPSILAEVNGGLIKATEVTAAGLIGTPLLNVQSLEPSPAGAWRVLVYETPESARRITDQEIAWLEHLRAQGIVEGHFNTRFFTSGDSREPELAGIRGALVGSLFTLFVTIALCLPIGVAAAIYLEEFAPKNRVTEIIEVNINNLAAVPSIVFGLLGLALFLNAFGLPRSAAFVGGMVLALLVLPTIIIASRAALKAVPPSIRDAALAVGASHQQSVFHHVLPLAMPGIMTGTIIGMAHALGETAPLLMIGMVAFIVDIPSGITDSATVLPVQIYLWSDLPELAFRAKTAAAILVLLVFLFVMNGAAIVLRRHFERRW